MLSSVLLFLNIGTPEMILIMFVALLLFGGDKLPGLARGLGKGIRDFKDASEGVKREINNQINSYEDKKSDSNIVTPLISETGHVDDENSESHPLINTEPVEGAMHVGEHYATENHVGETHTAENHIGENHIAENHAEEPHVHTPAQPVKITHE